LEEIKKVNLSSPYIKKLEEKIKEKYPEPKKDKKI